jgi:RimJ/RimL family protein N-acetyltransferase
MIAPTLHTQNLTLRAPREADFGAMLAFGQSPRSSFVGGPMNRWETWRSLLAAIGHWALRGYGFWSVDQTTTGQMIGRVGIGFHDGWPEPELGWHIYDGFEGQGYAYEAAIAARDHAARQMGLGPLISLIDPTNLRSAALAKRMGAIVERQISFFDHMADVYRHHLPEATL